MKTTSKFLKVTERMKERKYTIGTLAGELGIGRTALSEKLSGQFKFTFDEVLKIRDIIAPGENVEELFQKTI